MTPENTPDREESSRPAWIGPFVARGEKKPLPAPEPEVLPPLHLSGDAPAGESREDADLAASSATDFGDEAAPLGHVLEDAEEPASATSGEADLPVDAVDPDSTSALQHHSAPVPGDSPSAPPSGWDDEPWASTPVSDDPSAGIVDGDFLLDLPSVALPAEGIEQRDPPAPPATPVAEEGERDAPDWQQWLHENRAAGGHHFPVQDEADAQDAPTADEDAPVDMGGDLSGLEHYDWIDIPDQMAEPEDTSSADEPGPRAEALAEGRQGDYGWLDLSGEPGGQEDAGDSVADDFDAPRESMDQAESAPGAQRAAHIDPAEGEVEEVAARLERIARSLREHGLTGPLADRDPLGALIAGYLLGATSRGDQDGSR